MCYNTAMSKSPGREFFDREFMRRLERLRLVAKSTRLRRVGGVLHSPRMGDGLEFADHRAYAPGDDLRFIDWAYYARMERFLLRLFHEHSDAPVMILLDSSASMGGRGGAAASQGSDKFDYTRRLTATLAYLASRGLRRVEVAAFTDRLHQVYHMGRDSRKIFSLLQYLTDIRPDGRTDLARTAEIFTRLSAGGTGTGRTDGTVFIVSDLLDCPDVAGLNGALARLRYAGCEVVVIQVYSPTDAFGPEGGAALFQHAESDERMNIYISDEVRQAYCHRWRRFVRSAERTCLKNEAVYVPAPTDRPFEELVFVALRRSGILTG